MMIAIIDVFVRGVSFGDLASSRAPELSLNAL